METTRVGKYKYSKWAGDWWSQRCDDIWKQVDSAPYRFQKSSYYCDCCTHTFRHNTNVKASYTRLELDMVRDVMGLWKRMQHSVRCYNRREDWYDKF